MSDWTVKHCTRCGEAFQIGGEHDYGDVLDHWAGDHEDSEILWSVLENARTWTRCGGCGDMFPAEVDVVGGGLVVPLYCEGCADDGLKDKIKSLMVEDVTGRYVLDNELREEGVA